MSNFKYKSFKSEVDDGIKKQINGSLNDIGNLVEAKQTLLVPVRTGKLRSHSTHEITDNSVKVGIEEGVEYAQSVVLGDKNKKPNNFIRGAIDDSESDIINIVKSHFKGV